MWLVRRHIKAFKIKDPSSHAMRVSNSFNLKFFLNTKKSSFMLTLQVSLHLALICVNTLVFISSVKYLYGVTSFTHIYMPDKRFSYRGEKRASESSLHVETRMGKQK